MFCRSAPAEARGRKIRSPEPRLCFQAAAPGGGPQLRCGQAPRAKQRPSRAMPGSRSTGRAPRTGSPARLPRRIVFPPGRRFYENRYLCIHVNRTQHGERSRIREQNPPAGAGNLSGQVKIVENLHIFIKAALMRGDSLDHVLLHGPRLGKTTLANIIANEMGGAAAGSRRGPVLDKPGDLAGLLTNLNPGDVFSSTRSTAAPARSSRSISTSSAMEDYKNRHIVLDKALSARSIQIELVPFTLIGATTRSGLLTSPLRARFGIKCHLRILRRFRCRGHRATPRRASSTFSHLSGPRSGPRIRAAFRVLSLTPCSACATSAMVKGERAHRPRNHPARPRGAGDTTPSRRTGPDGTTRFSERSSRNSTAVPWV